MMEYNCSAEMNNTDKALSYFERVAYPPVFIVGLFFNVTALCIFCRLKRWTDTHIYMFNLLVADFLAIIFLPFRILEAFCPIKPSVLCTFLLCTQYSNMYSSIFTITAISFQRFIAVKFPFLTKALASRSKMIAISKCIFIWMIVVVICASNYGDLLPDKLQTCYDLRITEKLVTRFFYLLEILGYLIPVLIVILCSTQTIYILIRSLKHVQGRDKMERTNIAAIITANMFTFIVCFTPVHIGLLLQYIASDDLRDFVHVFLDVSEWIATTNCCLDSIGYYFLLKRASKRDTCSY
ncbi:G-protein coupled receptor 55 isoform X2 [Carassius gibelio]|uniref:G-protein coupled receptor 55 isoform X1 n=1 Tax=Carassius gibelio TaxID=101364 RepID=UPI002277DB87|nr:G-protein coupled receptor 55 isoform X1 [Carassius gibelio]XP_052403701.1 G-protein coupled receptor 55 isoform X2 [Carassius gibelio]